ncbi:MAG: hypothetical protein HPZ91_14850 [Lentisphaeria bacterium]|nr:hypothetical protein [Lentisphaeria bacterium]
MDKMQQIKSYLNRGWGVTPVGAPESGNKASGKNPFRPQWTKNPVRDMETAKTYWDNDKGYNVGVITGEVSGLVVLDIDVPEVFDRFLEKFPECRNTYIVRRNNAPEWKCHYYFRLDGFTPPSHNVKTTGWGDLMSNGKQVVAPPSVHYTGGVYEVVNDVEPLPFKREYYDALLKSKKKAVKKDISWLTAGKIPEGSRNSILFEFIRQLRNEETSVEEARAAVPDFCRKCDPPYDEAEALKTVESVFSYNIPPKRKKTLAKLNYSLEKSVNEEGESSTKVKPLPYHQVTGRIQQLLEGKVANINGELVVLPREQSPLQVIRTQADLFGYLGNEYQDNPDWKKGPGFMSREELLSSIHERVQRFSAVEYIPHYPLLPGIYYLTPELPLPNDGIIDELLDFFTPATPEDRSLILALFMTVLWGGAPGQRAPFAITSRDGRGVGKSTLAETAAKIIRQTPIQASTKENAQKLITRLLSSGASQKRVVMFDNETSGSSRISNGEIAALFTLETISGHKLYSAEASLQNNLVWIMTMNSPDFDSDFASRCVSISLKRPEYASSWKMRLNRFIEEEYLVIISTLLSYLKRETPSFQSTSRWGSWEAEVLAKVPGIDFPGVAALLQERRKSNDTELDELELIADGLKGYLHECGHNPDTEKLFIRNTVMANIVREATDLKCGKKFLLQLAKNLVDKSMLKELSTHRHRDWGLGFLWTGRDSGTGIIQKAGCGKRSKMGA